MKDAPVRVGRPIEAKEVVGLDEPGVALETMRTVTLQHSEDLAGRNIFEVSRAALCHRSCSWCEALIHRCQSRGGKVT
jgi:hypothetical protein